MATAILLANRQNGIIAILPQFPRFFQTIRAKDEAMFSRVIDEGVQTRRFFSVRFIGVSEIPSPRSVNQGHLHGGIAAAFGLGLVNQEISHTIYCVFLPVFVEKRQTFPFFIKKEPNAGLFKERRKINFRS